MNDYFHYSYDLDQLLTEENIVFDSDVYVRFLHNGYFSGATIVLDEVRVVVATQGDFDADGDVDGVDLGIWETGFGTQANASIGDGDADGDQDVDGFDFLVWQRGYDTSSALVTKSDGDVSNNELDVDDDLSD